MVPAEKSGQSPTFCLQTLGLFSAFCGALRVGLVLLYVFRRRAGAARFFIALRFVVATGIALYARARGRKPRLRKASSSSRLADSPPSPAVRAGPRSCSHRLTNFSRSPRVHPSRFNNSGSGRSLDNSPLRCASARSVALRAYSKLAFSAASVVGVQGRSGDWFAPGLPPPG